MFFYEQINSVRSALWCFWRYSCVFEYNVKLIGLGRYIKIFRACPALTCGSVCTRSELARVSVACGRPPGTGSVRGRAGPRRLYTTYTALCTPRDTHLITLSACLMCVERHASSPPRAVNVSRRRRRKHITCVILRLLPRSRLNT